MEFWTRMLRMGRMLEQLQHQELNRHRTNSRSHEHTH
jgi:hypothetical protein